MYTRKGDYQQASYRLCNLNPLHPILCALFIFIHIIDCGYSVESFNDAHEKNVIFSLYLTADAKFSWPNFDWEKYGEGCIFLSMLSSAFELGRPEKSCTLVFTSTYRILVFFQELMILYV